MNNNIRPFIRGKVVINSMRDNGYKNTAYALAELIDNSIQSGADLVELITFSEHIKTEIRAMESVSEIAVFDNGSGMSPETLHAALEFGASENRNDTAGIGKFGMGLPNSSISQCTHVDVWSWKNGKKPTYTYLDIPEIIDGRLEQIPFPEDADIPDYLVNSIGGRLPQSGTIVLWKNLDRVKWKTPRSIFRHVQDIIGRMYRFFINESKVVVKYKALQKKNNTYVPVDEEIFKSNDPLYLMHDTSLADLPGDHKGESFFEPVEDYEFDIEDEFGEKFPVRIRSSILKTSVLNEIKSLNQGNPGGTVWGKHALKNMGLSVVRAGRELALKPEFLTTDMIQKGVGRFSGFEISFPPVLDNIFGVLNNKQDAVNLRVIDRDEDAKNEGYEQVSDYIADLKADKDPKIQMYEVMRQIKSVRDNLSKKLKALNIGIKPSSDDENNSSLSDKVSALATNKGEDRKNKGHATDFDDTRMTEDGVKQVYRDAGYSEKEASEKARLAIQKNLKYKIEVSKLDTSAFFDVASKNGFTLVQINKSHPFYEKILSSVDSEQQGMLELAIAAWARMEDECSGETSKNRMRTARQEWGAMLADFLED